MPHLLLAALSNPIKPVWTDIWFKNPQTFHLLSSIGPGSSSQLLCRHQSPAPAISTIVAPQPFLKHFPTIN